MTASRWIDFSILTSLCYKEIAEYRIASSQGKNGKRMGRCLDHTPSPIPPRDISEQQPTT